MLYRWLCNLRFPFEFPFNVTNPHVFWLLEHLSWGILQLTPTLSCVLSNHSLLFCSITSLFMHSNPLLGSPGKTLNLKNKSILLCLLHMKYCWRETYNCTDFSKCYSSARRPSDEQHMLLLWASERPLCPEGSLLGCLLWLIPRPSGLPLYVSTKLGETSIPGLQN